MNPITLISTISAQGAATDVLPDAGKGSQMVLKWMKGQRFQTSKMNRAERNHQKWHKRLVIFIGHAGLVATASVCVPLTWGQMVGAQQQPAKELAITPKLSAAKWFAQDRVGAPAAPISNQQNHVKSFGGMATTLTIGAAPGDSGRSREPLACYQNIVVSAVLSSDGSRIVSVGEDGTVRQWDAKSGRAIGEPLRGHQSLVNSAAYSADGSRIVSAGNDGTVRQWEAKSGRAIGEPLQGHQDPVNSASYSADGSRIMSAGVDGTFRLWDAKNGRAIGQPLRCIL
jgi:hypothetical protein